MAKKPNKERAPQEPPQIDKFKKAARELECDDDEQRFRERLSKITGSRKSPPKKGNE